MKKKKRYSYLQLHQILSDFQNPFTFRLTGKFVVKVSLQSSPHLTRVATLRCEILKSENLQQSETG